MHGIVTKGHTSKYPDPIRFTSGDRLTVGRRDDDNPGWIWVTLEDGNEGWAPESSLKIISEQEGEALKTYDAKELDTQVGQHLEVLEELHGWLRVQNEAGESGWIPKDTVRAD
ncbi:MAG: SH3 domain-containing protein [Planctomycetota bacterium]|nr:SH3 domain-containing protein [Planctomycetota bacterium]